MSSNKTILIVEDDAALNDAYSMILSHEGYDVVRAFNGREAIDTLASTKKRPKVILLDLKMPVLDGIGFLKEFQHIRTEMGDVTVVVFSNYDAKDEIEEAYSYGADRYILKARATPKELLKLVKSLT